MAAHDDVLIIGSLSDKDMRRSIDDLVNYVDTKTNKMADSFESAIGRMNTAMKDFAINQKVSVTLMKEAWRDMSASFDAMVRAQEAANGRGTGTGTKAFDDNTVGALEQEISLLKQKRKEMQLDSDELRNQNRELEQRKRLLKEQTTSEATKRITRAMDMPMNDLDSASKKLRLLEILQRRYADTTELSSKQTNQLTKAIAKCKEQVDKFNNAKPKTLTEVLGMSEKGVDAIAKKMRALKQLQIDPKNTAEVKKLGDEYQRLSRLQSELLGKNIQTTHSNNYLAQSFGYIRNRLVYAMTLGAVTSFTKQIYEIRGQYELLERSLGVLVNSFQRGSQIFRELNDMAMRSPFTLMDLAGAAKQLTAYNFAANEVVDTTRRLADISAALGVPMERLTYNLGQIRAQTVLNARDARDFANAGLPIVKSLSDYYTELEGKIVSTGDVYDRMSKKMVSYSDVMAVLNKMTDEGGKFFDFQAKQAETLRVQINNLTLAWNNMLNELGEANQGLMTLPVKGLRYLLQNWRSLDNIIWDVITAIGVFKATQVIYALYANKVGKVTLAYKGMYIGGQQIIDMLKRLGSGFAAAFKNPATWITLAAVAIIDVVWSIHEANKAVEELNNEIRDTADEALQSLDKFAKAYDNIRKAVNGVSGSEALKPDESEKAWKTMREEIMTSVSSAESLIAKLEAIPDVNERIKKGFEYVDRIKEVDAALKTMGDDVISVSQDWAKWWNLWLAPEGLKENLYDYSEAVKEEATSIYGAYTTMLNDLAPTVKQMREYFQTEGFNADQQREAFERMLKNIAQQQKLGVEEYRMMRIEAEKLMANTAIGLAKEEFEARRSLQQTFFQWLTERHSSDVRQRLGNQTKQEIAQGKWLVGENAKWVEDMARQFSKQYNTSFDELHSLVNTANSWSVYIPVFFGNSDEQKKSLYDQLTEADKAANSAYSKIQRLTTRVKELESAGKDATQAQSELAQAQQDLADAEAKGGHASKQAKAAAKAQKTAEQEVADALSKEISIIKDIQSNYDKLRKAGVDSITAANMAAQGYEATLNRVNNTLHKYGITKFNASDFAGNNVHDILAKLQQQRNDLISSGKVKTAALKDMDVEIQKLTVDARTYDLKKITDGLNNELSKIKDDYELAVELDANPELGGMFADLFNIDTSALPHTFDEAMRRVQSSVNKTLNELNIKSPFNVLTGDLKAFADSVGHTLDSDAFKGIEKAQKYIRDLWKKTTDDIVKDWNTLLEKYGDYQSKMTQVVQETAKQQLEVIRKFGTDQEQAEALDLTRKITLSSDPSEIARIQKQLADLIARVVKGKDVAVKISNSISNADKQKKSKIEWEEFKDSELYSLTFEDMDRVSTRAIQSIISQLDKLKDKVKDDPASMKALMDAYKKGREELESRAPFENIITSLREWRQAAKEASDAQKNLQAAKLEEQNAQTAVQNLQSRGDTGGKGSGVSYAERLAKAQERLAKATKAKNKAEIDASKAEIKQINSQKKFQNALNNSATALQNVGGLLTQFAELLGIAEDSEAGQMVKSLAQGFTMMASALSMVAVVAQIAEMSLGWVAIVAAALSVVVGLVSFLAGASDRDITNQVKQSELAVKRLENSYKNLEIAVENAYGAMQISARKAAIANKELQLVELQRQLQLEKSRSSKKRDADKIADLEGQIIDLKNEIQDMKNDITNSFLGISSVSDAVSSMMDDIIDALRNGEDAMLGFNDSIDDMIANMIKQVFSARILGPMLEKIWQQIDDDIQKRGEQYADYYASYKASLDHIITNTNDTGDGYYFWKDQNGSLWYSNSFMRYMKAIQDGAEALTYEAWKSTLQGWESWAKGALEDATTPTMNDVRTYADKLRQVSPELEGYIGALEDILKEMGLIKDTTKENALSALQQGIQGVTEDTAGAIEAYMNGVSQQVYLQSDILAQMRDTILGFNLDVQVATIGQMLLQLQQSYQVQQSIENILQGVLNPSGRAFCVEMI